MNKEILEYAKRLKAISDIGLTYAKDPYDIERYKEIEEISQDLMSKLSGLTTEMIASSFGEIGEYVTPKVDIRAVIFNENAEILLVKEMADQKWSLPGGWADIGQSPSEVAIKEVSEETGFVVSPVKLLAILDKKCHSHPPELHYVYKIFIQCMITGGESKQGHDTLGVKFFSKYNLPELSENRVLKSQIELMFEYLNDSNKPTLFD